MDIMEYMIKELRDMTGMTQKAFAQMYGIPLSTLRKWEQGEASPAPYVLRLIAGTLPSTKDILQDGFFENFSKRKRYLEIAGWDIVPIPAQVSSHHIPKIINQHELYRTIPEYQEEICRASFR